MKKIELSRVLREEHGFGDFRPGQLAVLEATLAGKDVLAVLPTGAGKSLCYQMASRFLPGLTLVVSPLIALMKDQVDKMLERGDRGGTCLNSTLSPFERKERWRAVLAGKYRLLYVSPEALRNRETLGALQQRGVSLLVIDEAHCISHWGHDFRPDYTALSEARRQLGTPQVLAMTATATSRVQQDIVESLGLAEPARIVLPFDRPGLELGVLHCHDAAQKRTELRRLLAERNGAAIVYVGLRSQAGSLAAEIARWGHRAAAYHAGLAQEERSRVQEAFMQGALEVVVATNAFGMGVDKPDIRLVVEHTMPSTPEAFYQEAGRAGRDGRPAKAVLLFDERDRAFHEMLQSRDTIDRELLHRIHAGMLRHRQGDQFVVPPGALESDTGASEGQVRLACSFLERAGMDEAVVMEWMERWRQEQKGRLNAMVGLALSGSCRRRAIREYFGEIGVPRSCSGCDVCLGLRPELVSTEPQPGTDWMEISEVLRFVQGLEVAQGRSGLLRLLREEKAPLAWMRPVTARSAVNRMIEADLLQIFYRESDRLFGYPLLKLGQRARDLLRQSRQVYLRLSPAPDRRRTGRLRPVSQAIFPVPPAGAQAGAALPCGRQLRLGAGTPTEVCAETSTAPGCRPEHRVVEAPGPEETTAKRLTVPEPPATPATTLAPPVELPLAPRLKATDAEPIRMLRCGAFYELRNLDAETAAVVLGLKLGRRGQWPMTGVPIRKAAEAAEKLRARGYCVEMLRKSPGPDGKLRWAAEEELSA